eukprot:3485560-Rhodomonas_salina.1
MPFVQFAPRNQRRTAACPVPLKRAWHAFAFAVCACAGRLRRQGVTLRWGGAQGAASGAPSQDPAVRVGSW